VSRGIPAEVPMRLIGLAVVLAFSITLAPLVGAQQSGGVRRIGVLMGAYVPTDQEGQTALATFLNTLEGFGWAAGRNAQIEVRWIGEEVAQAKAQAAEQVKWRSQVNYSYEEIKARNVTCVRGDGPKTE